MRRKLIGLLGLVMAAGILMGMSKDDAPVLYVSEESVPESGKGIYNEQEQVSFVLRAEKSGDFMYCGRLSGASEKGKLACRSWSYNDISS